MYARDCYEEKMMEVAQSFSGRLDIHTARELVEFLEIAKRHYKLHAHDNRSVNRAVAADLQGMIEQSCEIVIMWDEDERRLEAAKQTRAMSMMPV